MCDDRVSKEPSAILIWWFQQLQGLDPDQDDGPYYPAVHGVCQQIKKENNWDIYHDICWQNGWPAHHSWLSFRQSVVDLRPKIIETVKHHNAYIDTSV